MDEVTLRTGKQANKRSIQFVLQALLALFGKLILHSFLIYIFFTLFKCNVQTHKKHPKVYPYVHQVHLKV